MEQAGTIPACLSFYPNRIVPIVDLSLSNPMIRDFFERSSEIAPVGEFLYIHTHYVEHNFVSQIENQILIVAGILNENPKKKGVAIRLVGLAEKFSEKVNKVDNKSAPEILKILREIYGICKRIIDQESKQSENKA